MLEHSPDLHGNTEINGNTEIKPAERTGAMGSGVLLTPLLFWGSCIVVGLKGADTAKVMCREGSAPIPGSPESMKLCREEPPRISPVPFKPGLPLGVSKLGDAKPCPSSP